MMSMIEKFVEKALNTSNLMLTLVKHVSTLTSEVKNIRESLTIVVKTVSVQQAIIEQLLHERTVEAANNTRGTTFDVQKNYKKEKPN
jgi:hypothetical protein